MQVGLINNKHKDKGTRMHATHEQAHAYAHTYTHARTHMRVNVMHIHPYAQTRAHTHARIQAYIHTRARESTVHAGCLGFESIAERATPAHAWLVEDAFPDNSHPPAQVGIPTCVPYNLIRYGRKDATDSTRRNSRSNARTSGSPAGAGQGATGYANA